jgi:hypothetical protein
MLKKAFRAFQRSGYLTLLSRSLKGSRSAIVLPSLFVVQQSLRVPSLMIIAWSVKFNSTLLLQSLISYKLAFCKLVWKTGFPFFSNLLYAIANSPSRIMFDTSLRPRRVLAAREGIAWLQKRFKVSSFCFNCKLTFLERALFLSISYSTSLLGSSIGRMNS